MRLDRKARLNYVVEGKPVKGSHGEAVLRDEPRAAPALGHGAKVESSYDREPSVVDSERGAKRATLRTVEIVAHRYKDNGRARVTLAAAASAVVRRRQRGSWRRGTYETPRATRRAG